MELNAASLSPDTQTFAVGGASDFWARVYDFNTGKELGKNVVSVYRFERVEPPRAAEGAESCREEFRSDDD